MGVTLLVLAACGAASVAVSLLLAGMLGRSGDGTRREEVRTPTLHRERVGARTP